MKHKKNSPFGKYGESNCTNFVSQVLLAGLLKDNSMNNIFSNKNLFVDKGELYDWYFVSKNEKSESWSGANGLYKYAKSNQEKNPPFKYGGFMFEFITRDYISSYDEKGNKRPNGGTLDVSKIQVGDIIFVDHSNKNGKYSDLLKNGKAKKDIKTNGIMDHAFVVTKLRKSKPTKYDDIYVTSSTSTYINHTLHFRNELNNYALEFHVYRPIGFVKK